MIGLKPTPTIPQLLLYAGDESPAYLKIKFFSQPVKPVPFKLTAY